MRNIKKITMRITIIILLIIAYISLIAEGFIYGIAEGLGRLGIVSLISAIIIPFLYFLYKDDKNNDYDEYDDDY